MHILFNSSNCRILDYFSDSLCLRRVFSRDLHLGWGGIYSVLWPDGHLCWRCLNRSSLNKKISIKIWNSNINALHRKVHTDSMWENANINLLLIDNYIWNKNYYLDTFVIILRNSQNFFHAIMTCKKMLTMITYTP